MDLLDHLRRQFAYDAWANREVLAAITGEPGSPSAPALKLLAHILSAERLWLERIRQQPQSLPVWPEFNLDQGKAQIDELAQLWREYLTQLSTAALTVMFAPSVKPARRYCPAELTAVFATTMPFAVNTTDGTTAMPKELLTL